MQTPATTNNGHFYVTQVKRKHPKTHLALHWLLQTGGNLTKYANSLFFNI